ncbi:PREDICTED: SET and MYND domain-containing protein 4-like [Ceratosolen solmsi marchali]|uniref:SET and MYND domain-containing protein 4-like n=1 Tax=Ceratosolen solmsi marchali TaxID=326594 RepID=A0AAJ6YQZ9_9HYME|nr:PREDICTED: SET and MYND domain-containing protein 4-like [Ceratosolen solmsi marchali]
MEGEESRLIDAIKDLDLLLSFSLWKKPTSKSVIESRKARQMGNELYTKNNHDLTTHKEILRFYTKSIVYAPPGCQELGLAFGNRSALLVHLGKYREAISDIDLALSFPLPEIYVVKYLCRKVECQAELGMVEAKDTCEETKKVLQDLCVSVKLKKDVIIKLVKAIVKLEKRNFKILESDQKQKYANTGCEKSSECESASKAVVISRNSRYLRFGRHLLADRDIAPGEVLYVDEPYVSFPMQTYLYTNCSHCLRFAWAGLPCDTCTYAIYCTDKCKRTAQELYHNVECNIIHRGWKVYERMNSARLMSVRLLIMAMKEAGSLEKLREDFKEIDNSRDQRKKGFSKNQTVFINNYKSAYSLLTHMKQKSINELIAVSRDSAVLLYFIARYTKLFRNHFDYDKKALIVSEDALFVGKLLSHYQHLILINAVTIKDVDIATSTDWSWTVPKEENCTGLYLTPFLSLLNHSCHPNIAKCETKDRKTILYSIRPITKGSQIFDCYGPTYLELLKTKRQNLLKRFYFFCDCIACKQNWPIFMNTIRNGLTFTTLSRSAFEATSKEHKKCDKILQSLKDKDANIDIDTIQDLAYAIILTIKYCKSPNWRLPSLIATLIAVFNELYGYVINIPATC